MGVAAQTGSGWEDARGKTMRALLRRLAWTAKRAYRLLRGPGSFRKRDGRRDEPQRTILTAYGTPLPQLRQPPYAALRQ